jgi:hypothetical protein
MKDVKTFDNPAEYEEPTLLGAEDLLDVAGGCLFSCSNGDCKPKSS